MRIVYGLIVGLLLSMLLTACSTTPGKEKPKVYCPACGAEFDAIIHQRF
jgi:hypothetical protein